MIENENNPTEQYANWKTPEASIEAKKTILTDSERSGWLVAIGSSSYKEIIRSIKFRAKEKGVSYERLLSEIRDYAKSKIVHPEKVKHFHRTSLDSLDAILKEDALLSREELKKRHPKIKLSTWSASDSVMMTKDIYNNKGELVRSGLEPYSLSTLGPGSGKGAVLVFNPKIIEQESYDAIGTYPTIDNAPVTTIEAILVDKPEEIIITKQILQENNILIPIRLRNDWLKQRAKQTQ